mmetsp:Transcript_3290/g.8455  ORF Transcript_3290/g.8455 Transcript_3290/m.8455 type:complete len:200 (+) Transcript_3290:177-776(+)
MMTRGPRNSAAGTTAAVTKIAGCGATRAAAQCASTPRSWLPSKNRRAAAKLASVRRSLASCPSDSPRGSCSTCVPPNCRSHRETQAMTAFGLYLCSPFVNIVPCVTCGGRQSLNYKYGLPINDCCCPCFAHYCCQTCALYQEIVYVKHVLKKEPTCCCYKNCCNESGACCPGTEPGGYSGIVTEQPVLVVSQQPADARA